MELSLLGRQIELDGVDGSPGGELPSAPPPDSSGSMIGARSTPSVRARPWSIGLPSSPSSSRKSARASSRLSVSSPPPMPASGVSGGGSAVPSLPSRVASRGARGRAAGATMRPSTALAALPESSPFAVPLGLADVVRSGPAEGLGSRPRRGDTPLPLAPSGALSVFWEEPSEGGRPRSVAAGSLLGSPSKGRPRAPASVSTAQPVVRLGSAAESSAGGGAAAIVPAAAANGFELGVSPIAETALGARLRAILARARGSPRVCARHLFLQCRQVASPTPAVPFLGCRAARRRAGRAAVPRARRRAPRPPWSSCRRAPRSRRPRGSTAW